MHLIYTEKKYLYEEISVILFLVLSEIQYPPSDIVLQSILNFFDQLNQSMKIDNTRIIWIFGEAFLEKLGKSSGSKSPAEGRRGKMPPWQKSNWSIFMKV